MNKILLEDEPKIKSAAFQDAFKSLTENDVKDDKEIKAVINIYTTAKDLYIRNTCIKLLYNKSSEMLKDFFEKAFKKERYLDMKILALRGLVNYIKENDIKKLLTKFNKTLRKRKETTPYNYQEYELLLGKNSLPYLHKKYPYDCIKETLNIVQKQYNEMPDAFKGHFTVDENGNTVALRSPRESSKMINDFFRNEKIL